jgi:tight adherence protein B
MTRLVVALMRAVAVLVWPQRLDQVRRLLGAAHGASRGASRGASHGASPRRESAGRRLAVDARGRVRAWAGRQTDRVALDRELVVFLEGLATTLRAGLTPARAFAHLATSVPGVDREGSTGPRDATSEVVDRAGRGDPLAGLRALLSAEAARGARLEPTWRAAAERWRSPALQAVAEGWGLSERHGAPVVDVLDALVGALRDRMRIEAAVQTALAAPRATARLLAVLPIGGVGLGELVGVHPLAVLVGTGAGHVAGVLGVAATLGGWLWMRRLVASVVGS